MVTMLVACLIGGVNYDLVNYDLVNDNSVVSTTNYSLFGEEPINKKPIPKFTRKPKSEWTFPGHTKEQLITHLKTHPNHKDIFKDVDLTIYDFQSLKDIHGYDHENRGRLKNLFTSECSLSKTKSKRILFFTAKWCPACKNNYAAFAPWLRKAGWKIGDTSDNHIQVIDVDANPKLSSRYKIGSLPAFVVIEDDKVIKKTGYLSKEQVPKLLN